MSSFNFIGEQNVSSPSVLLDRNSPPLAQSPTSRSNRSLLYFRSSSSAYSMDWTQFDPLPSRRNTSLQRGHSAKSQTFGLLQWRRVQDPGSNICFLSQPSASGFTSAAAERNALPLSFTYLGLLHRRRNIISPSHQASVCLLLWTTGSPSPLLHIHMSIIMPFSVRLFFRFNHLLLLLSIASDSSGSSSLFTSTSCLIEHLSTVSLTVTWISYEHHLGTSNSSLAVLSFRHNSSLKRVDH